MRTELSHGRVGLSRRTERCAAYYAPTWTEERR